MAYDNIRTKLIIVLFYCTMNDGTYTDCDNLEIGINLLAGPSGVRVIKNTKNIGIYRPVVFQVGYGPNQ